MDMHDVDSVETPNVNNGYLTLDSEQHQESFNKMLIRSESASKGDSYRQALFYCLARYEQVAGHAGQIYNFSEDQLQSPEKIEQVYSAGWMTGGYKVWIELGLNLYNDVFPADVSYIFDRTKGDWPLVMSALALRFDRSYSVN